MLGQHDVMPTLAVTNLGAARSYYEQRLGFSVVDSAPDGIVFRSGSTQFLVYESSYAGTNKATYMAFNIEDEAVFDEEVAALRASGIGFETFDIPDGTWEGDVLVGAGIKGVWFYDPDGNILNIQTKTA